jgi:translation initiation factor IF-2
LNLNMSDKKVKLFKIASEINIGKDAIVEFLQSKGFDVQNKPTTNLDEHMIELVLDKFKREKRAADIQREKIQKHKDFRQEPKKIDEKVEKIKEVLPEVKPATLFEKADEVYVPAVHIEAVVQKIEPAVKEVVTTISVHEPETKDVDDSKDIVHKFEAKDEVPEPIIHHIPEIIHHPEPEIIVPKIQEIPIEQISQVLPEIGKEYHKPVEQKPKEIILPVEEIVQIPKEIIPEIKVEVPIPVEEKSIKKESVTENVKVTPPPLIITETGHVIKPPTRESQLAKEEEDARRESRRKKKRKPFSETEPGVSPQLRGLTVLGKIDINPPKPAPKKELPRPAGPPRRDGEVDSDGRKKQFKKRRHHPGEAEEPKIAPKPFVQPKSHKDIADLKPKPIVSAPKFKETDKEKIDREEKKKKKRKKTIRELISQEEVNRAIRETLAGMDVAHGTSQRNKMRLKKKAEREEKELKAKEEKDRDDKILKLSEFVTTSDLANLMGITPSEVIMKCMELGLMVTINQRLDKETIIVIAVDYGFDVDFLDDKEVQYAMDDEDSLDKLQSRPPIVTIMGHVDHGKTSLLDHIRSSNVVAGEAGGITQHIGAYSVQFKDNKSITFLDTPGHEAFTAMRARGAQVTDIVVLVVAADDSVMPQTIEAISHARAANVPIVVAINKIDKTDANPDRIRQQLTDYSVLVEEWGGKNQCVEISAKKGINIDILLDKILLEAELLELKANPDRLARGIVIESNMSKGFGSVATVIIQKGTLRVGDPFVSGVHSGKVRALLNEREKREEQALPGDPILVIGFDGLPEAGDTFVATYTESEAREIANERKQLRREQELRQIRHVTLDEISAQIQLGGVKDLNLVIKGDVAGSVEALSDSLLKLSRDEVKVNILHKGVGPITETDVMLAAASGAVVIGFNVNPTTKARKAAEAELVDIRQYNIIYDCINEIQLALEGLLSPEFKEEIVATVEVRKVFRLSRLGSIAGCYVTSGKISRSDKVRVMRDGFNEHNGGISSLKRGRDDVREVETGFECGIQLDGFNSFQEGDIIEAFKIVEIRRKFV